MTTLLIAVVDIEPESRDATAAKRPVRYIINNTTYLDQKQQINVFGLRCSPLGFVPASMIDVDTLWKKTIVFNTLVGRFHKRGSKRMKNLPSCLFV